MSLYTPDNLDNSTVLSSFRQLDNVSPLEWGAWMYVKVNADSIDSCIAQCFWRNVSDCLAFAFTGKYCYLGHPQTKKDKVMTVLENAVLFTKTGDHTVHEHRGGKGDISLLKATF